MFQILDTLVLMQPQLWLPAFPLPLRTSFMDGSIPNRSRLGRRSYVVAVAADSVRPEAEF